MHRFILLLLLVCNFACASHEFIIQPRSYWLSTHYDIYSNEQYLATVEKEWLHLPTTWSLCNENGVYASGKARLLSMGSLLNSMKEIDIFDSTEVRLNYIQGDFSTTASGKYLFHDDSETPYAVAFIDQGKASVNIVDYENQRLPIAVFRRQYTPGGDYYWHVNVIKEGVIDRKTLYIFAAFITDACWPYEMPEKKPSLAPRE